MAKVIAHIILECPDDQNAMLVERIEGYHQTGQLEEDFRNWVNMFCQMPDVHIPEIPVSLENCLINPKLYVAVFDNDEGLFPEVHTTELGAERAIDDYVKEFWYEVASIWKREDGRGKMPRGMRARRMFYFDNHPESERAVIETVEVHYDEAL